MTLIDRIFEIFAQRGGSAYLGEEVSQTEHALQAAWAGEQQGLAGHVIAAALLHDIGHLLHELPENCAEDGVDDRHEAMAADWLANYFPPAVVEPIRLHVDAKRYLCATEPGYFGQLSVASVTSLKLQGGPMNEAETVSFRENPFWQDAIALRRLDELAKVKDLPTPPLEHFRPYLEQTLRSPMAEQAGLTIKFPKGSDTA